MMDDRTAELFRGGIGGVAPLKGMAGTAKLELVSILSEIASRSKKRSITRFYPDEGPLNRSLYPKHLSFFRAGRKHRERILIAGNRVGKTVAGAFEVSCHLTGIYPHWWDGKRFTKPVRVWASGDTGKTTRDVVQLNLMGPHHELGTGMIPADCIVKRLAKPGVPDAIDTIYVRHISGGTSILNFKSYDQRREGFQGTEQDVIWLDEEPPLDVYTECLLRTMTTKGIIILTFTPLSGLSDTVISFMPDGQLPEEHDGPKHVTMMGWDDAPHLTEEDKAELILSIPPYQRDARTKGIPQLGSGAIYPVPESEIVVDDFEIPAHWPRVYALDVGWNRTAAVWAAVDEESGVLYLYSEHYQGQQEPAIHAQAIQGRGKWIPGVIDPAARGRGQKDGYKLLDIYRDLGLELTLANNAVEAGLYAVWQRLSAGKIKVFKSMHNWLSEYRVYRRDEKGHVVKKNDHLMDATRYLVMTGVDKAEQRPLNEGPKMLTYYGPRTMEHNWLDT